MPPTTPSRGGPGASRGRPGHAVPTTVGKGKGGGKLSGKTILSAKRHRKILKDQIQSITKPDIRRLARRGGVKRISAPCYNETRHALKQRLEAILKLVVTYVEYRKMKTVTVEHVIFSLRQLGTPIYGFDPNTYTERRSKAARDRQTGGD